MSSQSPQRTRKAQRDPSPSPSLRERQRYTRTQSMPLGAPVHELADKDAAAAAAAAATATQGQLPPLGYPRPIARVAPPQFLAHAEKWQMTDELHAEIARADQLLQQHQAAQPPAPGTEGVAYAGGAVSTFARIKSVATVAVGTEAADGAAAAGGPRRRPTGEAQAQAQHRASPLSYALRKTANASPVFQSVPSPRATKNRTPDRSLPVQEEPDEHEHEHAQARASPAPSSDLNPAKDLEHDAEGTLVDLGDDDDDDDDERGPGAESTEGESSHTPRSPSSMLFEQEQAARGIHEVLQPDKSAGAKPAQGSKAFNAAGFQHTLKKLQSDAPAASANGTAAYPPQSTTNGTPAYPPPPFSRNESRGSYPNWIPDFYHNYPEEMDFYDEAAYMNQFMPPPPPPPISTQTAHMRPGAPIPPTPHSQTSAPTPFQNAGAAAPGQNHELGGARTLFPPFSPAPPPSGTPYPYPFSHVRRTTGFAYPAPGSGGGARMPSSVYDPGVVQEQLRLQMQMYAYNNGAQLTDATLSPASTPYPGTGPSYAPFSAFLSQSRALALARAVGGGGGGGRPGEDGRITSASIRSSPSHLPVRLPLPPQHGHGHGRGRGHKRHPRSPNSRGSNGATRTRGGARVKPPPRVESTQPRETSPEPSSSGEETAGEKYDVSQEAVAAEAQEWANDAGHADEENGGWVDEDSEGEHDLLDLEFHPSYVANADRRRRRWEQRLDELVRAFQALDRETDATLVLLAAPSHTTTLHALASRAVRRDAALSAGRGMHAIKASFAQLAAARRAARTPRASLLERLYAAGGAPGGEREADLRGMLRAALHSLGALREMYDGREARWREEERRMREEREGVDVLLQQAFGAAVEGHPAP